MDLKDATLADIFEELSARAGITGVATELHEGDAAPTTPTDKAIKEGIIKGYERPGFVVIGFSPVSKKDDEAPPMESFAAGPLGLMGMYHQHSLISIMRGRQAAQGE